MKHGRWVVINSWAWKNFILAFLLVSNAAVSGIEIGNGALEVHNQKGGYTIRLIDDLAYEVGTEDKVTEIMAPQDDGTPRTRLLVKAFPICASAEDGLKNFVTGRKGWVSFSLDRLVGAYKEVGVSWSRLEMNLFRSDEHFVITLEGNKLKSDAYKSLAKSLLSEIRVQTAKKN